MLRDVAPRVIPRKEHRISRKQVSPNALRTLYRLHRSGFIAYLVGGCVRDLLLARTPKDFDIATNATPGQVKRLFRNCRLIGRRFRLAHIHFQDEILEVSTFRRTAVPADAEEVEIPGRGIRPPRHVKDEEGMVLVDNVFGTPEEDALRRDFTINALAYNIADFSVIDYSTGLEDLRSRLIRLIGDPRVRFTEDPIRMLRAVRFAASHNFTIEPDAWEAICELSPTIARVSSSRVYEEILKLFLLGSARPAFALMEKSGLLTALFPGLGRWICGNDRNLALLLANLDWFDKLVADGAAAAGGAPTPSLLLAALFGPTIEKESLALHRTGVPGHQALEETCGFFMKEVSETVCIPRRMSDRMRSMLALQRALRKMPPRRPASTAARPEFAEALAYLRLGAETRNEHRDACAWWDTFLLQSPPPAPSEAAAEEAPEKRPKRRRRRRRGPRRVTSAPVSGSLGGVPSESLPAHDHEDGQQGQVHGPGTDDDAGRCSPEASGEPPQCLPS
jgi:poly(A) polymerase